ncbi:hypothetical protein LshimejAT787_1801550 [Lyophyllum shimeji]|uniref:Uncharacterized protein n=1 Tax=Lyophyllum shimeji TaxID=47721 RepID=A0A9P3PZE6_LYOSH|nr:hypothetical protein LshimejAT787_1801550 [Lyophyllum shimeji]
MCRKFVSKHRHNGAIQSSRAFRILGLRDVHNLSLALNCDLWTAYLKRVLQSSWVVATTRLITYAPFWMDTRNSGTHTSSWIMGTTWLLVSDEGQLSYSRPVSMCR